MSHDGSRRAAARAGRCRRARPVRGAGDAQLRRAIATARPTRRSTSRQSSTRCTPITFPRDASLIDVAGAADAHRRSHRRRWSRASWRCPCRACFARSMSAALVLLAFAAMRPRPRLFHATPAGRRWHADPAGRPDAAARHRADRHQHARGLLPPAAAGVRARRVGAGAASCAAANRRRSFCSSCRGAWSTPPRRCGSRVAGGRGDRGEPSLVRPAIAAARGRSGRRRHGR